MARMHLWRLASTFSFSRCAGAQGYDITLRMLHSSSQTLIRPTIPWLNKYPSWSATVATSTQFNPFLIPHDQTWSNSYSSRSYCMKRINGEGDEVSVTKDGAIAGNKPSAKKALDGGAKFNVVRVNDDGSWHHLSLRISELVSAEIHPRDVEVLTRSTSFVPQRATISVRSEKVMVRMENVRALICKDHALLFEARRPPIGKVGGAVATLSSKKRAFTELMDRAREFFAISMAEQVKNPSGYTYEVMPFHLKMVECLLEETSGFFNQKVERLKVLVERVLEELTSDVNMGGLQRLLPLKRALTELEHDIRDAHNAMEQVLNSDENLQALCFQTRTPWSTTLNSFPQEGKEGALQHMNLRQAAADMLLTYQREFDDAGGALEELRKDLNAAQEIWELGLDTTRNRIIRSELMISIGTLSVYLDKYPVLLESHSCGFRGTYPQFLMALIIRAAVVGAFFGMNLQSGLEDHATLFWWVTGCSTATSVVVAAGLFTLCRARPRIDDKRRAQDLAGLQNLLQHLDDLDDIFQVVITEVAGKPVTQNEFLRIVRKHPFAQHMSQSELDLVFRLFDVNRNRVLELKEFHMQYSR